MVLKQGKATVLKSGAGTIPSLAVTVTGMTTDGTVIVVPAERDSLNDTRGQMEFYGVCTSDTITIYGELEELQSDTDVFWFADTNGQDADAPQVLTGAGAVDIIANITHLVTAGVGDALTLADGIEGQSKIIVTKTITTGSDTSILTPTSLGNGTTITFDAAGDCAELVFTNSAWHMIGGTATLA